MDMESRFHLDYLSFTPFCAINTIDYCVYNACVYNAHLQFQTKILRKNPVLLHTAQCFSSDMKSHQIWKMRGKN